MYVDGHQRQQAHWLVEKELGVDPPFGGQPQPVELFVILAEVRRFRPRAHHLCGVIQSAQMAILAEVEFLLGAMHRH